jgi:hypothetical protein
VRIWPAGGEPNAGLRAVDSVAEIWVYGRRALRLDEHVRRMQSEDVAAEIDRSLDEVVEELNQQLERLRVATSVVERIDLRERLNELRAEAAVLRGPALRRMSDEQLENEIRSTRRLLDDLRSQRFDPSMVAGASGRGGGLDPLLTAKHNQRVDEAGGREHLEARLHEMLLEAARRAPAHHR